MVRVLFVNFNLSSNSVGESTVPDVLLLLLVDVILSLLKHSVHILHVSWELVSQLN